MERAEAIESLKHGVFPDGFVERYPKEVNAVDWMSAVTCMMGLKVM